MTTYVVEEKYDLKKENKKHTFMILGAIFTALLIIVGFIYFHGVLTSNNKPSTAVQEKMSKEQIKAIQEWNSALVMNTVELRNKVEQDKQADTLLQREIRLNTEAIKKIKLTANDKVNKVYNFSSPELSEYFSNLPRSIPEAVSFSR